MSVFIKNDSIVLFQGDSITDYFRNKDDDSNLGSGYVMMTAALFSAQYPEKKVKFINRGISGDRVKDLQNRWKTDCLDLKTTWVSIMIGINDCWRRYDSNDPTTIEDFEAGYRGILKNTIEYSDTRLILCEPFLLPLTEDLEKWREDLDPKIGVVHKLAREFNTILVPLDGLFAQACTFREPEFWTTDGVHPTPAGNALIARAWLQSIKAF
jgi:Lysophospholipase L1 and related esterases